MNVAHQLQQVLVPVAQYRFVAPLEQMSYCAVTPVVDLGVSELYPLHDLSEGDFRGFRQQVNVVTHQNIGVDDKFVAAAVVFEALEVSQSVLVIAKKSSAVDYRGQ
jgi:hypothetical protein